MLQTPINCNQFQAFHHAPASHPSSSSFPSVPESLGSCQFPPTATAPSRLSTSALQSYWLQVRPSSAIRDSAPPAPWSPSDSLQLNHYLTGAFASLRTFVIPLYPSQVALGRWKQEGEKAIVLPSPSPYN